MPDENLHQLQVRIAQGNQVAFGQLYNRYKQRLIIFSQSIVHTREVAEEVVEDVFVSIWQHRQNMLSVQNLPVYLYVATKNKSLNAIAKRASSLITQPFDDVAVFVDTGALSPCDLMVSAEMMHRMKAAIETLPPRCKMIFKLVREDGLKYKDIAEVLNISVNTIDAQMAIAIKRISATLEVEKPVQSYSHRLS